MNDKIEVICFLDNPLGRDTEIILPITFCLEKYFECKIAFLFVWDIYKIRKINPDIILLPNTRGHNLYYEIAKFASVNGITVLALESEGNFPLLDHFNYWGYNLDKMIYQKVVTCWSDRVKNFLIDKGLSSLNNTITTGATGFDRYIFELPDTNLRNSILSKLNKSNYSKVIGYAGWAFGKIYGREKNTFASDLLNQGIQDANEEIEELRLHVESTLETLIQNNPDTLFILKKHPKEQYEDDIEELRNEMNALVKNPNVLYLKNEIDIKHLITISDIWMGFETTTLIEAWLLNKPTILINKYVDFPRANLHPGSLIEYSSQAIQNHINEYYKDGKISDFVGQKLKSTRQEIISNSIGFGDGFNHLRVIRAFKNYLLKRNDKLRIPLNLRHLRLYLLMHIGKYFYYKSVFRHLPGFKKSMYVFENRELPQLETRRSQVYTALERFHEQNKSTLESFLGK